MTKLAFDPKCPNCKHVKRIRIKRRFWMRLIPWTKYYHCGWCGSSYFSIFDGITVR